MKPLNYIKIVLFFIFITVFYPNCKTQSKQAENEVVKSEKERGDYRIMFYNCENLFDTFDDTLKNDDEFLPKGKKYWSERRYYDKLKNIAKVIVGVGGWEPPEIVGLCEVENHYVLEGITKHSPLKKSNYKIIHYESPDKRGIDVAMLYQPNKFTPIKTEKITVRLGDANSRPTRDILYVKGFFKHKDTLHIFVNHWPSRWGGMLESEPKRRIVAKLLRQKVDSLFTINQNANILIMGDLNDFPENESVMTDLRALTEYSDIKSGELYNLSYYLQEKKGAFSHSFHGERGILDQMIISGNLLKSKSGLRTSIEDADVYNADFLLEKDDNYSGMKPFRTYIGYKYHGGFSDHLPAYLDLWD